MAGDLLAHLGAATEPTDRPRDSREKLADVLRALAVYRPTGGLEAALVLVLRPSLSRVQLPDDPADVDDALDQVAAAVLALKSDPGSRPEPAAAALDTTATEDAA
jgi:hypothetical protein